MVRIVGIAASPRHGNTEILVKEALHAAQELPFEVETEFISFVGKNIKGCIDCGVCVKQGSYCWQKDDWLNLIHSLIEPVPDGVIIGSPVYFFNVPSLLRAFFERCTCLFQQLWHEEFPFSPPDWTKTAAGAIAVGFHRHGGVEHALETILEWFLVNGFVCVGGDYIGGGAWQLEEASKEAVHNDSIGMQAAKVVGQRVAYTAKLLHEGKQLSPDLNLLKIG